MMFSLIICTYMRPKPLLQLLLPKAFGTVREQTVCPDEILIIDGSANDETEIALEGNHFGNLHYFLVSPEYRGLTKQRNYTVSYFKLVQ